MQDSDHQSPMTKRRLTSIFVLTFWSNLLFSLYTPVNPLPKGQDYYYLYVVYATCILFSLFITRRKYRLPRRYIFGFSLISHTISMVLLSIQGARTGAAHTIVTVISRIFLGFGWSSCTFVTITLISWLFTGIFQILFSVLLSITLMSYSSSYLILKSSNILSPSTTISFAVISGALLPFLYVLPGDLSYQMTQERYNFLHYLNKRKQVMNFSYLTYVLFGKMILIYGIFQRLKENSNSELAFVAIFAEIFGGIIGNLICCCFSFKTERNMSLLALGIGYSLSFIFVGPWAVIIPTELWISGIGLIFNGIFSYIIIVNLVVKILNYGTMFYNFEYEALVSECVAASYISSFSIAGLFGPIIGLIFNQFLEFSSLCLIICFTTFIFSIFFYRLNKTSLLSTNAVETEPVQPEIIQKKLPDLEKSVSSPSEPAQEPISKKSLFSSFLPANPPSDNYEYNFFSIQSGYYSDEEEFPSFPSKKESISNIRFSGNVSLPMKWGNHVGEAILEQKNEESSGDKRESSKSSGKSGKTQMKDGITETAVEKFEEVKPKGKEKKRNKLKVITDKPKKRHVAGNDEHKLTQRLFKKKHFESDEEKNESEANLNEEKKEDSEKVVKEAGNENIDNLRATTKIRTQPPVFVDAAENIDKIDDEVMATSNNPEKVQTSESESGLKDVIKELSELFPENVLEEEQKSRI